MFSSSCLVKAMNDVFAPEGPLAKQLGYLEKMHPGDGPYFNNQVRLIRLLRLLKHLKALLLFSFLIVILYSSCQYSLSYILITLYLYTLNTNILPDDQACGGCLCYCRYVGHRGEITTISLSTTTISSHFLIDTPQTHTPTLIILFNTLYYDLCSIPLLPPLFPPTISIPCLHTGVS